MAVPSTAKIRGIGSTISKQLELESSTGLRALAANLREMATAFGTSERAARLIAKASDYENRARQRDGLPPTAVEKLRADAAYIQQLCRENPEPQWQRAKVLACTYLREADQIEKATRQSGA